MEKLNELTIKQASEKLRKKEITSIDLTKACLEEIKRLNPEINAFILVTEKEALKAAEESDRRIKRDERRGELDGIPIAIKDNMCTEGVETTAGSKILKNFISPEDATVVSKLKKAGAVILGKTNLDEFAMGSSTETSAFGPTKNPHDLDYVPGGSSGGSAAAVASNMCIAALGSDTGGSIRQPASFCGVFGFKPTYGAVSRYGLLAMASSLDQIGPITKTVEDAKILFDVIKGYDEKDSTSINQNSKIKNQNENAKLKIGVPAEYFGKGLDPEVEKIIRDIIERLKGLDVQSEEVSLPYSKYALPCYYIIMPVEVSSNLARYDGVKYGLRVEGENLLETYMKTRSEGFGKEAKRRIMIGTYTSSAGYYDAYYLQASKVREKIKQDFDKVFSKVDLILGPTSPTVAFRIGEKTQDPLKMYLSDIYTVSVNLAGLPAASIPVGKIDKLPVGLQLIGPKFSADKIFEVAKKVEAL